MSEETAVRARLFFSVIPYYLSVASGRERCSLPNAQRGVLFSPGTREMYVLSRDKKNECARAQQNRTRCARGILKRDIFMRLSFIVGEKFSPHILFRATNIFFALNCRADFF